MQIVDFTTDHIEAAAQLAKLNYDEERSFVPILPPVDRVPDLKPYASTPMTVYYRSNSFDTALAYAVLMRYGEWTRYQYTMTIIPMNINSPGNVSSAACTGLNRDIPSMLM